MSIAPASVSADHAKRWAERARLDLEASADRGEAGLNKIRTAIAERHDLAIGGYNSIGDYVSDQYADALGNVCRVFGVEFRRQVVAELSDAGEMSTRAIAAVTGTSHMTAQRDQASGVTDVPPAPEPEALTDEPGRDMEQVSQRGHLTGEGSVTDYGETACKRCGVVDGCDCADEWQGMTRHAPDAPTEPAEPTRPAVVGLDGKTYQAREKSQPKRKPLADAFTAKRWEMQKALESLSRLTADDRFPQNAEKVATANRSDLVRIKDQLELVIEQLPEHI